MTNVTLPRNFAPGETDILYHYCDGSTFVTICTNKTLRFSDIFAMNDFMEMHWGYHIWELAATKLMPELEKPFLDRIDEKLHSSGLCGLVVCSCFSFDGDVLSHSPYAIW